MTEKLFYQDSRIRKFTARVESCRETEKNQYEVVLDRTAFFPEEGGQYADSGRLFQGEQEIPVFDVQEKNGILRLQEQYIKGILAGVKPEDTCVLLFEEELDPAAMRSFVNDAMEITTGICGVFIGNEEEGYRYVLGSKEQNINAIAKEMNQAFNGRGGGKPPMVQGSLKAAKENIEEFLKNR